MKYFFSTLSLGIIAIVIAFSLSCINGYFYPMKFEHDISLNAQEFAVNPALVASVANVESGFRENVRSNKGAVGIMQLLPSTASWLAQNLGEGYSENMLYNPSYNIRLGTFYLSYLLNIFEDENSAICAYNAGQAKVRSWLENEEYSSDRITLNKIPFSETENYLNKVTKNYHHYEKRYK